MYTRLIQSPIGRLTLIADEANLVAVLFEDDDIARVKVDGQKIDLKTLKKNPQHAILNLCERQFAEYFAGKRVTFDLPIRFTGTDLQMKVWKALTKIKPGQTKTYTQIAKDIKSEKAVRAVGTAIGRNPISLVVPCHRVIGSDGQLRGFAGGTSVKKFLLNHEGVDI